MSPNGADKEELLDTWSRLVFNEALNQHFDTIFCLEFERKRTDKFIVR